MKRPPGRPATHRAQHTRTLRLTDDMAQQLATLAQQRQQSINATITAILTAALSPTEANP
jgi:predicted HicB family RNase H-like nuclease